jgi:UDP-N-acetylglucosamine acyltransferase
MGAMTQIDPSARIADGAKLGKNVSVGPYCVIGPDVTIADDVRLVSHVHVTGHTSIGARTVIYPFASLGTAPQSVKYRGGPTRLTVGADCDIREHVTMNTGTEEDGGLTQVGDRCFIMVGSHVAHDCRVGNGVTMANHVLLAGHAHVGDNVLFGGAAVVKQFVRIGEGAMITGMTGVRADVIPWGLVEARIGQLVGFNIIGMKRRGVDKAELLRLRQAYRELFFGEGQFRQRIDKVAADYAGDARVQTIIEFIRAGTRPLTMAVDRAEGDEEV